MSSRASTPENPPLPPKTTVPFFGASPATPSEEEKPDEAKANNEFEVDDNKNETAEEKVDHEWTRADTPKVEESEADGGERRVSIADSDTMAKTSFPKIKKTNKLRNDAVSTTRKSPAKIQSMKDWKIPRPNFPKIGNRRRPERVESKSTWQ